MFCAHCGEEIERASKFCTHCGKAVASAPTIAGTKSHLNKIFAAIGAAIVVGVIAYFAILSNHDAPTVAKELPQPTASASAIGSIAKSSEAPSVTPNKWDELEEYRKNVNPSMLRNKAISESIATILNEYANGQKTAETLANELKAYHAELYKLDNHLQRVSVPNWLATTHGHLTSACSTFTMAVSTLQFGIERQDIKLVNSYAENVNRAMSDLKKYNSDITGYYATLTKEK